MTLGPGEPPTGGLPIIPPEPAAAAPEPAESREPAELPRRRLVDLAPLRASRPFARLWFGNAISGIGAQMTIVAVGLQLYAMTGDTLAVALVGGIALVPMIVAGLWGGMLVDAFDRRLVLLLSSLTGWVTVLGLAALSWWDAGALASGAEVPVWPFYVLTTINAVATTISGATRSAITPRLLPPELISRATALNGIALGAMLTIGPAVGGVLAATIGLPFTFLVDAVLFTAAFVGILGLPHLPPLANTERPGLESLKAGMRFLRNAPNIRMSFIVDIIAMTFGRPYALFPAVGALAIGGGAVTVGILTAAGAVGTFMASVFSGPVAHVHRHGLAVQRAIMVYGAFVAAFGATVMVMMLTAPDIGPTFAEVSWPGLIAGSLAMAGMGASDEISAIFRSTMLIVAAPDEMRGRLQGVFMVVVAGGPRIGDLYAGIVATALVLWAPPLAGGILIIVLVLTLTRLQRGFLAYDSRTPTP